MREHDARNIQRFIARVPRKFDEAIDESVKWNQMSKLSAYESLRLRVQIFHELSYAVLPKLKMLSAPYD